MKSLKSVHTYGYKYRLHSVNSQSSKIYTETHYDYDNEFFIHKESNFKTSECQGINLCPQFYNKIFVLSIDT